jgi:hypothetical protein
MPVVMPRYANALRRWHAGDKEVEPGAITRQE